MRSRTRFFRVGAWLASTSLTTSLIFGNVPPAMAQPAPPSGADMAGDQNTNPPALAGRLAEMSGTVSYHAAGETQWTAATLNYPVTNGGAFWTEPQASATLEIADDRVVMDGATELDMTALDQSQLTATAAQGAIFLQMNSLPSGQTVTIDTPRGAVQIGAQGRYEIVAGDTNDATTVTVLEGSAHVSGNGVSLDIGPQQTATIGGTDTLQGNVGPIQQDAFLQAQLNVPAQPAQALPQQCQYMTGAADLPRYGSFSQTQQYGQVWYPNNVPSGWAPYRDGHWAYVQPWGWTWVDNAQWGFAPFHYGRWIQTDDRWGWVAGGGDDGGGYGGYPVYSPALVSFVDVGGAALAGAALGFAAGELAGGYAPAWIPLGPREPYYPWYHTRGDYFSRVNARYGVPRDIIARGPTYVTNVNIHQNIFINRRGATVVPAGAFARGEGLRGVGRPLPERALADARPIRGRLPVRPTAFTPNLSRDAARRYNVALPARPNRPEAAGPRISENAGEHRRPDLRKASLPGNVRGVPARDVRAGGPNRGAEGAAGPGMRGQNGGLPPLRGPGERPGATPGPNAGRPNAGRPEAPGPQIGPRGQGGLPALRAPDARPDKAPRPGAGTETPRNGGPRNDGPRNEGPRNDGPRNDGPRNDGPRNQAPRNEGPRNDAQPGREVPRPGPENRGPAAGNAARPRPAEPVAHPQNPPRPAEAPRAPEAQHAPKAAVERPQPQQRAPREARPQERAPQAPRPEQRPAPRMQAPRAEAPRPAPRAEAPRPAPRMEAPRPQAPRPAPRPAPARPAPHPEPPHKG